jgi:hypothetical protein
MDLSLHTEMPQTGFLDAHRRCWWAVVSKTHLAVLMILIKADVSRIPVIYHDYIG